MTTYALEKVLQYAYFNGYTCIQWVDLVKQYLEQSEQDLSPVLCDLLLKHFFSTSRVHSILLETYVAYALTGGPQRSSQGMTNEESKALIQGKLFVSHLVNRDIRFASNREYSHQWSCILRLLPSLLVDVDGDRKEHLALAPMLTRLLVILSHIVAVGLYPHRHTAPQQRQPLDNNGDSDMDSDNEDTTKQQKLDNNDELNFSLTNNTTQLGIDSQLTLDPDATLDVDATQPGDGLDDKKIIPVQMSTANDPSTTLPEGTVSGPGLSDMDALLQQDPSTITSAVRAQHITNQSDEAYHSTARGSSMLEKDSLEWENTISAAKLIIDLIEKKGLKRIIEKYNQGNKSDNSEDEKVDTIDPWVSCHRILMPDKATSALSTSSSATKSTSLSVANTHNVYIQKLLLLVERLTDRDLERRLAVHMKYHELEDEGTARAMPSAGLMGLVYHMVQICPTLDDDELLSRLVKLQAIKGSFDESFYLELWFVALTGLREASLSTSCQNITPKTSLTDEDQKQAAGVESCNTTVATNRLLWKNLVLVKLPHLIYRLQEQKEEEVARHSLNRDLYHKSTQSRKDESNAIESSLMELKTFTGLLNACNPPACCPEFYVPSSKSFNLVKKFAFGGENDGSEEHQLSAAMDDMIDDSNYATDFNTPTFIKAMQSISKDDIFTCILRSCRPYKPLGDNKIEDPTNDNPIKTETNEDVLIKTESLDDGERKLDQCKSLSSVPMDVDTADRHNIGTLDAMEQVDQNIEQRMAAIQSNTTKASLSELIHIGLVSLTHWRRIVEFLLKLLNEKAQAGDVRSLYRLCGALNDCPTAIDLVLQLHPPSALLTPLETICNGWNPSDDYMDVDDGASGNNDDDDMDGIQNWYYKFGKIWIFVLVVASKFDIANVIDSIFKEKTGLCYQFFVAGPTIYGVHAHDQEVESLVGRWLSAMGGDGISDDLLRTTNLQMLLRGTPTIIDRLLCIYDAGRIEAETFTEVLSYFRKRFLHFVLVPGVVNVICDELLNRNASAALTSMTHLFLGPALPETLIGLCGNTVLGSLHAWMESQRQYKRLHGNNKHTSSSQQQQIPEDQLSQMTNLERFFIARLDVDDERHLSSPETISNGVTRRTLTEKSREMFRYIVKSGRSMYMNNVDGDARNLWEPAANGKPPKQVVSHYLDLVMFQAALKMGGAHWFISMIVDEVLEAGKSGGAVRAAELGSCLLTTPLLCNTQAGGACLAMLRCLLQDVIPSSIKSCSTQNTSFFQGQTVGVFVSDCLVMMYQEQNDPVDKLGCQFFNALVIDRVRGGDLPSPQLVPQTSEDGSRFSLWDEDVVSSPVWRGFVKGLMSNPFIKEMWPNAYAS